MQKGEKRNSSQSENLQQKRYVVRKHSPQQHKEKARAKRRVVRHRRDLSEHKNSRPTDQKNDHEIHQISFELRPKVERKACYPPS